MRKNAVALLLLISGITVSVLSCSKGAEDYFPMNEGRVWEYKVSGRAQEIYKQRWSNLAKQRLKGELVTPQKIETGKKEVLATFFYGANKSGIFEFASQHSNTVEPEINNIAPYLIKYPLKVGTSWDYKEGLEKTIVSIDDIVTVPAGIFKGCIKIKSIGVRGGREVEHYVWYAPGVGRIKATHKEKSLFGAEMSSEELESFK